MTNGNRDADSRRDGGTHVSRLTLSNFRNYRSLSLDLSPGPVVLTGENGAGKTNLLEAVSFLTPGRGLRRAAYADVSREGAGEGFAVHAHVSTPLGACEIGTGTSAMTGTGIDAGETARKVRINGANARTADEMLEWLRVIWLTPAMDALFGGPAGDRRRFLDRLVLAIDPLHGRRALDYEKAMRARNRLLAEDSRDNGWFDAIESQLAETGTAIAAARVEMVALLDRMISKLPDGGPFPRAVLALEGFPEDSVTGGPSVDIEEIFRRELRDGRGRDRAAGRTLSGPHRSDLLVRHGTKDMPAHLSSTGEQKALLVGIIVSHARLVGELSETAPILLLDEIAAHLDEGRRAALFDILDGIGCQHFMTGTEAALFRDVRDGLFLSVAGGRVEPGLRR